MNISNSLALHILQNKLATYSRSWIVMRRLCYNRAGYFTKEQFIRNVSNQLGISKQSAYKHLAKLLEIGWIYEIKDKEYRLLGHELLHRFLGLKANFTTKVTNLKLKTYKGQLLAIHSAVRNRRQYYYEQKRRGGNPKIARRNLKYEGVDTNMHGYYACTIASEDCNLHHSTVMSYRRNQFFNQTRGADVPINMFDIQTLHLIPEFARANFQFKRVWKNKNSLTQVRIGGCYEIRVPIKGMSVTLKPFSLQNSMCLNIINVC